MPLTYNPEDASKCIPEGEYDAVLYKVEDRISKTSGNAMQVWHVDVYDAAGGKHELQDYVTASAAFKIAALARAVGKAADFDAGRFQADDYQGQSIRVALKIEKSDQYGDQNKISKYLPVLTSNLPPASRPAPGGRKFENVTNARPDRQPSRGPAQAPYGNEESVFKEDDIPF